MPTSDDRWDAGADPAHETADDAHEAEDTQRYRDLLRAVNAEWSELEQACDQSVQLSPRALSTIKASVRAEARHGARVEMPATPAGPYTLSELSLRTLVRRAVDSVPGARSLRTTFEHASAEGGLRNRGEPTRIRCRVSAHLGAADLRRLADDVRAAVSAACSEQLALSPSAIDVHIEDLHDS